MSDFIFNIAKGRAVRYADLPETNDAWIAVPIETAGLETASTAKDADTLAAFLAGTSNEQTTMTRVTLTGVIVVPDDTNDWNMVDCDNIVFAGADGNPISGFVICYDSDTTAGTDSNIIPICFMEMIADPSGGDLTYVIPAGGFYKAA